MNPEMWQAAGALVLFVAVLGAAYTGWVGATGVRREKRSLTEGHREKPRD